MSKANHKAYSGAIGAALALAVLIAANVLVSGVRLRRDLTEDRLYTISDGTTRMLREMEKPVALKLYFSRSNPQVPMPLKNYVQRTVDFLREIESRSGGKVTLEVLDPRPDTETEEWAQRYGLVPQSLGGVGAPPDLYLGLVAISGTREAAIPVLAPALEPQMEYLVARLIQEAGQSRRPRVALMSGLPMLGTPGFGPMGGRPDWLFVSELKAQYEVVPLPTDAREIPEGTDVLLLVHPGVLGDRTLFAVDQYLLRGGRLVAFVDPACLVAEESPMGLPAGASSDLNRLTRAWGVELAAGRVLADPSAATPINVGDGRAERLAAWLSLRGGVHVARDEIATGMLDLLMLPFAGHFSGGPADGLEMATLLSASDEATSIDAFLAQRAPEAGARDGLPAPGAPLAVRLSGRFPAAFPDGPPAAPGEEAAAEDDWLRAAQNDGVAVLVADADMLANRFLAQTSAFFGRVFHQPINDNLNFALNLVEQLSGDPALVALRSRGRFHRPFERVLAMEKDAQARWQQKEEELERKLMDTQRRLQELQAARSDDQQLVLSAEQRAEIERFRQERFEVQRQLTEVRRNLRRSIERLGLALKIANMAAVPLLVAAFGIAYGWVRRRRAAA